MLHRLSELRAAAGLPTNNGTELISDTKGDQLDRHHEEYLQSIVATNKEIEVILAEIRTKVDALQGHVSELNKKLLPHKSRELLGTIENEERHCSHLIQQAKAHLEQLQLIDEAASNDEVSSNAAMFTVRQNFVKHWTRELCIVATHYLSIHNKHVLESMKRGRRQLRYAFPEAQERDIDAAIESPALVADVLVHRLECGSKAMSLDGIVLDLESRRTDVERLEAGARELKMLLVQFSQGVDAQGEVLKDIEVHIDQTCANVEGAEEDLFEIQEMKNTVWHVSCWTVTKWCVVLMIFGTFVKNVKPLVQLVTQSASGPTPKSSALLSLEHRFLERLHQPDFFEEQVQDSHSFTLEEHESRHDLRATTSEASRKSGGDEVRLWFNHHGKGIIRKLSRTDGKPTQKTSGRPE
eukprot:gnl/TRDRNA2_/TRDRNA2_187225_c0_seq1.p1 gnl/TRDRNA2_/TRDRNA2_187225_c0~~gnl/TRDRNA2_/TRDRNA2_187225_c0_seq1.p1  ORF type:complete len:410 (+),score=70.57 gnl/TRDRNA2_/TRDRNA2_187225_c0_seq1:92-1321(+)